MAEQQDRPIFSLTPTLHETNPPDDSQIETHSRLWPAAPPQVYTGAVPTFHPQWRTQAEVHLRERCVLNLSLYLIRTQHVPAERRCVTGMITFACCSWFRDTRSFRYIALRRIGRHVYQCLSPVCLAWGRSDDSTKWCGRVLSRTL